MKRIVTLASILLLVLLSMKLSAAGQGEASNQDTGPIKIGVVIPLSGGPFAEAGEESRLGFLMAEKEINESGGILGRQIQLIIEDDQSKPETGIAACTRLITQEHVVALLGGYSSTITYAQMNAIQSYEPLMVWEGASSTKVEHEFGNRRWFFHMHPWDYHRQSTVVDFLTSIEPRPKTIALTYEDGIYGTTSADYFRKYATEAGFQIVLDEPHKSGSADFTSLFTKAKNKNPDIFYSVSYAGDYIIQIKQAREIGFSPKAFVIVAPLFPNYVNSLGETGDNIVGVNPWAPTLKIEGLADWMKRFQALHPEKQSFEYWLPLSYSSLMAVAEAIRMAGSTDKEAMIAALEKMKLNTPFGLLEFNESEEGGLHQAFTNLVMVQWQNLQPVVVYPKAVAGNKLVYPIP